MSAGAKLVRALVAGARAAGCPVHVTSARERPWASATFIGARHTIVLEIGESLTLAAWLAELPEAEFALPGHIVADLAVGRVDGAVRIDALTLVEA